MKLLLAAVNAKYIHSNLAVYSLRGYLKEKKNLVEIAEYTINHYEEDILADIYRKKPQVIAFSCYIWNIGRIRTLIQNLKKVLPEVPIWVGGPEVSYDAESFLKEMPEVKGVIIGEGEETFKEVVESYEIQSCEAQYQKERTKDWFQQIKGIVYRNPDGQIKKNPPRELLSMDAIPFPYDSLSDFENRILYYESSRGCPYSCSYCLSSIEKKVRFRSLSLVKEELLFFLNKRVLQVKFVDRTFNCDKKRALELWRFLLEHDNGVTNFHFEVAAELITEEQIQLMKKMRPGLIQLEIGVQTTNPKTIQEIRRTMDFERLKEIVGEIQNGKNIHQHLDLIAGLPYEGFERFKQSFDDVHSLYPQQLQLGFLKVLKGSYMYEKSKSYGLVYHAEPVYEVLSTKWLTFEELLLLKDVEEMVEVYYNSGQFLLSLKLLASVYSSFYDMYEEMAEFYRSKQYHTVSHSRMRRYEILLEFVKEKKKMEAQMFQEALVYDLYLREKCKSRPDFAKDLEKFKKKILDFYKTEDENRKYLKNYDGYYFKQLSKMTHVEVFSYDFPAFLQTGELREREVFLLFDYKERDPLSDSAKVTEILTDISQEDDKEET